VHGGVVPTNALTHRHQRQTRLIEPAGVGELLIGEWLSAHRHTGLVKQRLDSALAKAVVCRQLSGGCACLVLGYQFGNDDGF
jgi:hypothetical protein